MHPFAMLDLRPTFTLLRRYLTSPDGEQFPVEEEYRLPRALRERGYRIHVAPDYGTLTGDIGRLRELLSELKREDEFVPIDAVLDALDEILKQETNRRAPS